MIDKSTRFMKLFIRTLPVLVVLAAVGWLFLASLPPVERVTMSNESRQEDALDREPSDNVINTEDELHEGCVVSILNRTAKVQEDGSWRLSNIPVGLGPVRARFTCLESDGRTRSGQSDFFVMEANQVTGFNGQLSEVEPIPASLAISATTTLLTEVGATSQLTVTATYPDGSTGDVSRQSRGTGYTSSNPTVVGVSADGLLTAFASGSVLISVLNEGALGMMPIQVVLGGDSDGDGIPNDVELANGLDPNNPVDGLEDPDQDLLTNQEELMVHGTDFQNRDSDGDTILDGEEVVAGEDGHITNPLLVDSDNDGLRDALEVAAGSDPTDGSDPADYSTVVDALSITPSLFVLTVNSIVGEASQQLSVTGQLIDGSSLDLTSGTLANTNYASSDLTVCNFGGTPGEVFGSTDGTCTITATNSGLSAEAIGVMETFTPTALTSIAIPTSGYANNVDVVDDELAFVAAGAAGLQVIDVSNLEGVANLPTDRIIGSLDTTGTAIDVKVVGDLVYLADGASGLAIIDVSDPTAPTLKGVVNTSGIAQDLVVSGDRAYVADGTSGLAIIDVSNPTAPTLISSISTQGTAKGVGVSGAYAAVAIDSSLKIVDVSNDSSPQLVGSVAISGGLKDVALRDNYAYVAAYNGGLQVVDVSTPSSPQVVGGVPGGSAGFVPRDVALEGRFALAAEQIFPNAIPIVDINDPSNPLFRTTIDLSALGDYAGTGIALTEKFVYVTEESFVVSQDYKATGDTRLFIAQYLGPGKAKMVVDPNPFDFGSVVVGAAETRALTVENSGQGTLLVSQLSLSGNDFAINDPRNFTLAPGASRMITMTFAPSAVTPMTGTLIIESNDSERPTRTVAVVGAGQEPPDITLSPDSFAVTLSEGNSTTETLTIGNVGTGPLSFEIEASATTAASALASLNRRFGAQERGLTTNSPQQSVDGQSARSSRPQSAARMQTSTTGSGHIAVLGADGGGTYLNNVAQYLTDSGRFASVTTINGYSLTPTLAELQAFDAVGVFGWWGWASPSAIGDVLADYVDGGGNLFVAFGANGMGGNWQVQGRFSTDNYWLIAPYTYRGGTSFSMGTVYEAQHPIMAGVSSLLSGSKLNNGTTVAADATRLADFTDGTPLVVAREKNGSRRVDVSFPMITSAVQPSWGVNTNSNATLLITNAFEWLVDSNWLNVDPESGTVAPGSSQSLNLSISGSGLSSGTYTNTLSITSNDPDEPQLTVPVTLTITAP
ncbi:MAG: choice-of-anchor D domain-containing protein [Ardenticatenaceae bacterium]